MWRSDATGRVDVSMTDLQLVLVRHGETEWIERGLIHGRLDSPLSARGREHAASTARRLRGERFEALYSSPAGRAMQTAAILGQAVGLKPVPVDGLREMDFGWFEGRALSLLDVNVPNPLVRLRNGLARVVMGLTGESRRAFSARIRTALETIVQAHARGRVLIVAHFGVLSTLTAILMQDARNWNNYGPWGACSISELHAVDGRWQAARMNDTTHLNPDHGGS
jgi:broad specificity phosphatase PhoE